MRRGRVFCGIMVVAVMMSGRSLEAGSIWNDAIISGRIVRVAISGAEGIISLVGRANGLPLSADSGGGDGGDGDGSGDGSGSSDTGSSGDGSVTGHFVLLLDPHLSTSTIEESLGRRGSRGVSRIFVSASLPHVRLPAAEISSLRLASGRGRIEGRFPAGR